MKTPSLHVPSIKLNRKVVYITLAGLVVLSLFTFAVVKQVQAERLESEQAAAAAQSQKVEQETAKRQLADLKSSVASEQQKNAEICQWVRSVQAQRRQAVPPLCRVAP